MKINLRHNRKLRSEDGYAIAGMTLAMSAMLETSLAATVAGTAVGVAGAMSTANAKEKSDQFNAAVAANNAGAAAQQGKFDAAQISDATRRNVANQRAAMAA